MTTIKTEKDTSDASARAARSASLHFECLDFSVFIHENIEAVADVWEHLQTKCDGTIYQDYFWQKAWFDTIGKANGGTLFIMTGYLKGDPSFLIPLFIDARKSVKTATWLGGDHANYRFGLFSPADSALITKALPEIIKTAAKKHNKQIDLLYLPQQPFAWDDMENPIALAFESIPNANSGGSITMNENFDEVLSYGNAKRKRKNLRSQERALDKLGGYQFIRTQTADDRMKLFDTFVAQKKEWFAKRGIKNKFNDEETRLFFNKLAHAPHPPHQDNPLLEFDYILADGEILALQAAGTCYGQHFGYFTSMHNDPKYASISPGSLVFYKSIEMACSNGLKRFDFGVGADRYKKSWCNENHSLVDVSIPITVKGSFLHLILNTKTQFKAALKKNPKLWEMIKRAREKLPLNHR